METIKCIDAIIICPYPDYPIAFNALQDSIVGQSVSKDGYVIMIIASDHRIDLIMNTLVLKYQHSWTFQLLFKTLTVH